MSFAATDPFTALEGALWHILESSPRVSEIVKLRNREKLVDDGGAAGVPSQPIAEEVTTADLPRLVIIPGIATFGLTSTSRMVTQAYTLAFETDQQRMDLPANGINVLKWAILCAFEKYPNGIPGLDFTRSIQPREIDTRIDAAEASDYRIRGWKGLLRISVEMVFNRKDMVL